jgi:hypothetical protein
MSTTQHTGKSATNSDRHLSPTSNNASGVTVASGFQTQIIEDRYLEPEVLKKYLDLKFPGQKCRVQVS